MASRTRKRKQSNSRSLDDPMQPPLSMTTRTHVGRRVSNGAVQDRQSLDQVMSNPQRNGQANLALNDEIGLEDNHLMGCHAHSSIVEEPIQQNTYELINETAELQSGHDDSKKDDKKGRGPTYMLQIWGRPSTLPLIQLDFDSFGRPKGPNRSKFSEFLGTIARNGMYCPLDVEDWHKMPKENKKKMIHVVKSRYDISLADEGWILTSINKSWRNWKSILKTRYFLPGLDTRTLEYERDGRVLRDQWIHLLEYWNKEEVKVRSEKNKVSRSKKPMNHLTGKTPFAKIHDKLAKEKGRSPSRAEIFESCYTSNKNTPSTVSKYLEEIEVLRRQLPEGSEDRVGPNDLYAQVCGPDKPGRVKLFGEGLSPSDVWGEVPNKSMCKRIMLEQRSEMLKLRKEMAELQSKLLTQQSSESITSVSNNLLIPTSPNQHLKVGDHVAVKSISDQRRIVAKGCLQSIDPNVEVGGQVLGENWCQVQVKVVLQSEELLVRPYGYCQTLEDALGGMVAWPCNFVMPIG